MNTISNLSCVVGILLCVGCVSPRVWIKDNTDALQAQKDLEACKYEASKHSFVPYGYGTSPISAGIQEGFQTVNLINQCMIAKGYYLTDRVELERKNAQLEKNSAEIKSAMERKDFKKALELTNLVISEYPNFYPAYARRGSIYSELNQYNDAISDYSKAISLGGKDPYLFVAKATAFIETNEYDIAIELINQILLTNNDASLYNIRAYALNKKGEYDKALEDCNKSIALNSSKPNPFKNKGLAYLGKGEYTKSIEQFDKAIAIDDKYALAYLGRGDAYLRLGKLDNSMSDFKKACEYGDKEGCLKLQPK